MKPVAVSPEIRDGIIVAVIVVMVSFFFVSVWLFKGAYFVHDIVTVMAPLEELFAGIQRAGHVPWWSPNIQGGYPLLGFGQLDYYYPLHWMLRPFLSGVWIVNISLALHLLIGALGMFALLRSQRLSSEAGGVAALVFVFGGAVAARFAHIAMVLPLAWLPWSILGLHKVVVDRSRWRLWLILWVGANTWQVMAGHPQTALMGLIAQLVWFVVLVGQRRVRLATVVRLIGGSMLVMGFLLPHVLPMLDVLPLTDRAEGLTEAELFEFSAPPSSLAGLIVPHPYGRGDSYRGPKGEAELALYVGPVALALAGWAAFLLLRRRRFTMAATVGLLLAMGGITLGIGEYSPVYRWLALHTPQSFFSVPSRYFLLLHLAVVFLLGYGLDYFRYRWRMVLALTTIIPVLLVAATWETSLPSWSATSTPPVATVLADDTSLVRLWAEPGFVDPAPSNNFGITVGDTIDQAKSFEQTLRSPYPIVKGLRVRLSRPEMPVPGEVRITIARESGEVVRSLVLRIDAIRDGEWTEVPFEPLALSSDEPVRLTLSFAGRREQAPRLFFHTNPGSDDFDPTGTLSVCEREKCRAVTTEEGAADASVEFIPALDSTVLAHEMLIPHIGAGYGLPSGQWTGALPVLSVSKYLTAAEEDRSLLNRLAISHLVTWAPPYRTTVPEEGWKSVTALARGGGFIHVFQNEQAWPRWHFATSVQADVPPHKQLSALRELPEGARIVISEASVSDPIDAEGTVHLVRETPTKLIFVTDKEHPGFLVVRDVLVPGWEATLDGRAWPLYLTDALWRGVHVPAGHHEIVMEYYPAWLRPAAVGCGLAMIVVLVVLGGRMALPGLSRNQRAQRGKTVFD